MEDIYMNKNRILTALKNGKMKIRSRGIVEKNSFLDFQQIDET